MQTARTSQFRWRPDPATGSQAPSMSTRFAVTFTNHSESGPRDLRIIERGYGLDPWDTHKLVETVGT